MIPSRSDHMSQTQPSLITGGMVFFMLVAFFGVVIGVNLIMMRLAIQTLPGTEVDSAYSASLAREGNCDRPRPERPQLESRRPCRAQRAGWRDAAGRGARQRRPADVRAELSRPVRAADRPAADLPVALAEVGIGIYRGSAGDNRSGPMGSGARRRCGGTAAVSVQEPRVV